jgi:hypothetical protein
MADGSWSEFLAQVDMDDTAKEVLDAAEAFLLKCNLPTPRSADGAKVSKLEARADFPEDVAVQAFLVRAFRTLDAVTVAQKAASSAEPSRSEPGLHSALGLAATLAPPKKADTERILREAQLEKLPFILQVDQSVVDRLQQESDSAKSAGRPAFAYIDLTSQAVTPTWLMPEAIGARYRPESAVELDGAEAIGSLARLGQALRGATENQKFFRSFMQWSACWWRLAPFQIALKQLTWCQALCHADVISQLAEEERQDGRPPFAAFLYDELLRRQLEKRASRSDPSLNLDEVFLTVDKTLLAVARQRLAGVLRAAAIAPAKPDFTAQAANYKSQAEQAATALHQQQADRVRAGSAAQGGKGSKSSASSAGSWQDWGNQQQSSSRQAKKSKWWNDKRDEWKSAKAQKRSRR